MAARGSVAALFDLAGVDEVVTLAWTASGAPRRVSRGRARLRAAACDTAILLPNSFASAWLAWRARVPQRWGYARDLRSRLLTRAVARPARQRPPGRLLPALVRALGVPNGPLEAVLTPRDADVAEARRCWLPAAGTAAGRWWRGAGRRVRHGQAVAAAALRHLVGDAGRNRRRDVRAGRRPRADAVTTAQVRAAQPPHAARARHRPGRRHLAACAGRRVVAGRVCVSNDSGAMHLAAAVGVPVAAIFGPTNEHETAPLTRAARRAPC